MVYKSLNNLAPKYLKDLFVMNEYFQYDLRTPSYFQIPKYSTNMLEFSYSVQGAKIINKIIDNRINIKTKLNAF